MSKFLKMGVLYNKQLLMLPIVRFFRVKNDGTQIEGQNSICHKYSLSEKKSIEGKRGHYRYKSTFLYTSYSALSKYWGHLIGNSSTSNSNKVCYTEAYIFFSNLLLLPIEKRAYSKIRICEAEY